MRPGRPASTSRRCCAARSASPTDGSGKQTLANLSALPAAAIDAVEAVLKGKTLVEADAALAVTRSLPHGHVALVAAQAARLGLPQLLGPGVPGTGPGLCVDRLAGAAAAAEVGDPALVGAT